MRTEQALHEFIASCIAANLSPATMQWYNDRLFPFARSCPTLRRRPEPVECFLAEVQGSPKTKYDVFRVLKTSFKFRGAAAGVCPTPWMPSSPHAAPRHSCRHSKVGELMRLLHSSESTSRSPPVWSAWPWLSTIRSMVVRSIPISWVLWITEKPSPVSTKILILSASTRMLSPHSAKKP